MTRPSRGARRGRRAQELRARSAQPRRPSYSATRAVAPSILTTLTVCALGDTPRCRGRSALDHSSPPMRTRPPSRRRPAACTVAFRPTRAAVPVRDSMGSLRWLRAIGRRTPSDATDPARKTSTAITAPAPSAAATRCRGRGERHGAEEEETGRQQLADRERRAAITTHTSQATSVEALRSGRARQRARAGRRSPSGLPDNAPHGRRARRASRSPSRALDVVLDRVTDHQRVARSNPSNSSMRRKIASCGFVFPCARDVRTASTVEPVVADELVEIAGAVREQPELQACGHEARRASARRPRTARNGVRAPTLPSISTGRGVRVAGRRPCPR